MRALLVLQSFFGKFVKCLRLISKTLSTVATVGVRGMVS